MLNVEYTGSTYNIQVTDTRTDIIVIKSKVRYWCLYTNSILDQFYMTQVYLCNKF